MRTLIYYLSVSLLMFLADITAYRLLKPTRIDPQITLPKPALSRGDSPHKQRKSSGEVLLSETENAYNPIPNPDGSLIAYVRTGWGRPGGSGGFGSSNLVSDVMLMNAKGEIISSAPLADAFLYGWTPDGKNMICYRDGEYSIVSADGKTLTSGHQPEWSDAYDVSERIAFLPTTNSFLWLQDYYTNIRRFATPPSGEYMNRDFVRAVIQSPQEELVRFKSIIDVRKMLIPSPNERYLALVGANPAGKDNHLQIFDRQNRSWADLGEIIIHPDDDWDYIKPSWNPWFSDSSRLTYVSRSGIIVSSPDGKSKQIIFRPKQATGLAVPSPDGESIAYATFEPRPMKMRHDLKFWGGSTIWIISAASNSDARAVTQKNKDTTYSLRWLNNQELIFDRIADEIFYGKARLWKVDVSH